MKVIITGRDKLFLEGLAGFYILTTKQIKELYFTSIEIRTVLRRLRKLNGAGYLRRFRGGETAECIWALGKKAEDIFGSEIKIKGINRNSLKHDLKANELRIHLNRLNIATNFMSGFSIRQKINQSVSPYDRSRDTIPDWIFSLNMKAGVRTIALECEISYKGKRRMASVFERYSEKKSINYLWYVVPTELFKRKILNCFKENSFNQYDNYLWVSTFDDFFKGQDEVHFSTIDQVMKLQSIIKMPAHKREYKVSKNENL